MTCNPGLGIQPWRNPLQKLPTSTKAELITSSHMCEPHTASVTCSINIDIGCVKHWCDFCNYETQKSALTVKRDVNFQFYKASALCYHSPPIFKETVPQRRLHRHTGTIQWQTATSRVNSEALFMQPEAQLHYRFHFRHDWQQILKPQMCAAVLVMYESLKINMIYQN
jgi:hypothetical protein